MKQALLSEAQNILKQRNLKYRQRNLEKIYFKLFQIEASHVEKNNYFEYNIEDTFKYFAMRNIGFYDIQSPGDDNPGLKSTH